MSFARALALPSGLAAGTVNPATLTAGKKSNPKAWAAAQDFEATFLHSMFENMFTDIDGEGPFGGDQATGIWRSFLSQEYAKSYAKAGGIGLASQVYQSLIAHQEANARAAPPATQTATPTASPNG